jgi:quinoprotein glucose dehydrogenase
MGNQMSTLRLVTGLGLAALLFGQSPPGQNSTRNVEWRYYAGDAHSTKYSPLDQINESNVQQLQIAWRWKSLNYGARPDYNWEVTPLMIGGVLYFTAGLRRDTVAVDAASGETLWIYRLDEGERGAVRTNNRGLAYWTDGKGDERILVISPGYQLVELNAKTGKPVANFGSKGMVDLRPGLDRDNIKPGVIGATSPAMIVKDVVIVGAALLNGASPPTKENVPGYVRGFDVHTGKLLWTFHTIPRAGEFGNDTWLNDSWKYTGNTAVWAPMSADEELGYVYLPVEMPTGDEYGGHRPGNNLFADSLVCLDAKTGKRIWHYQLVHHDLWDWDNPSAPVLLDVTVNGKKIKAIAQTTKQAFVYVFDRVTGQPVWPIEERPVPKGDAPGEWYSATQPFPSKPKAVDRQGVTLDDLVDYTPEIKAEALRIAGQYKLGPIFTPPIVVDTNGKKGTLMLPAITGGGNWQGAAGDPETGVLYVPTVTNPYVLAMTHDGKRSDMDFIKADVATDKVFGLPLVKGPWGRITAIDLNTGDHMWMVPNGTAPDEFKNNPVLKGVDIGKEGNPERAPLLVTRTLLFSGDGGGLFAAPAGAGGPLFRALNKKTGATIYEMKLPGNETGMPMTYMVNGRQFIVVAIGATGMPAELVALSLPAPGGNRPVREAPQD